MKAAAAVFEKEDFNKFSCYEKLMKAVDERLRLCMEQSIDVVVFPALLGCLQEFGERYTGDILKLSIQYKDMTICPGSVYEKVGGETFHSSYIIINGSILLKQRQIYLAKWEKNMGLSRGTELNSISIGGINMGMLISTDVFYPQVSRAFAMRGVELVLSPVAVRGEENAVRQLAGLWQNVQANSFFGVESGYKGSFGGYEFHSRSMIHAPLEMTRNENGMLAVEGESDVYPIITAEIDNGKRMDAIKKFNTLAQLNREAYRGLFCEQGNGGCYD